jgi:membrane protease YdiL (CAAX protease family)
MEGQKDPKYSLWDLLFVFLIFSLFESILLFLFPQGISLLFILILQLIYVGIVLLWVFRYRKWTKTDLGLVDLSNSKNIWSGAGIGLLLAFVVIGIDTNTVYLLFHEAKLTGFNFLLLVFILPVITILSPMEEIVYRGFLFTLLRNRLNLFWGIVLSSLFFAFAHKLGGSIESIYSIKIVGFTQKFLLGGIFAYFFYRTKSLAGPIMAHLVYNWCVITITILVYFQELGQ